MHKKCLKIAQRSIILNRTYVPILMSQKVFGVVLLTGFAKSQFFPFFVGGGKAFTSTSLIAIPLLPRGGNGVYLYPPSWHSLVSIWREESLLLSISTVIPLLPCEGTRSLLLPINTVIAPSPCVEGDKIYHALSM